MKEKIDWYKEVLELEPGSKVFFPLARLLAENGQIPDALSTLRLGLGRHPEFIEARLYLIELLYTNGEYAQCEPHVGQLTRLFSAYSGFWEAWGMCSAANGAARELPLALKFLALLFKEHDTCFGDVMEKGLQTFSAASVAAFPDKTTDPQAAAAVKPEVPAHAQTTVPAPSSPPSVARADLSKKLENSAPKISAAPSPAREERVLAEESEEETEEPFSLRTRSMAELLAGQGDPSGALEIYRELAGRAQTDEDREEMEACILRLSSPNSPPPSVSPVPEPTVAPQTGQRMQHLLESLAERLEARAAE